MVANDPTLGNVYATGRRCRLNIADGPGYDLPTNAPQRRRYNVPCRHHHSIFHFVTVGNNHEGGLDGRRSARKVDE